MTSPYIKFSNEDFVIKTKSDHDEDCHLNGLTEFDHIFQNSWKRVRNIMNYSVASVKTKVLPGNFKIIVQLNPLREQKRRAPASIGFIKQAFDKSTFNFMKVKDEEILFEMLLTCKNRSMGSFLTTVIVNLAPICTYHGLLIPMRMSASPQILNEEGLTTGISAVLLSGSPSVKVGFNSLGGLASVNHNHWHIYYLPHHLAIETAKCEKFAGPVFIFTEHYAPGFIFNIENTDVDFAVKNIMKLVNLFLEEEICHNVMITRGLSCTHDHGLNSEIYSSIRICIWARKPFYGVKNTPDFAAALCEFGGHVPIYNEEIWNTITEEEVVTVLNDACADTFRLVAPKVKELFSDSNAI